MKRSEKCNQTSPSLRRILTSPSVRRIQTSPSMSANTLQRRLTLLGTLVLKLYANVIQSPVLYYQIMKKKVFLSPPGIKPATYCATTFQLLFQPYYLVVMFKSESCIVNQKYVIINYSCFLPVYYRQLLLF